MVGAADLHFALHGVILRVGCDIPAVADEIARFLVHLGLAPCTPSLPDITIDFARGDLPLPAPDERWEESPLAGYSVLADGGRTEVRDARTHIRIDADAGRAVGTVAAAGERLHMNLVSHALLTLLRCHDLYPLHAAGVTNDGAGVLVVADSGGGKSTLTTNLLLSGWSILGDDSLLLRPSPSGIEALALRRDLFVLQDNTVAGDERDHGTWPDAGKLRIDARDRYPDQVVDRCRPTMVVFPHIVNEGASRLEPCADDEALHLLAHHGLVAELERRKAADHMAVLAALVGQCRCLHLVSGRDLIDDAGLAARLLRQG